MERSYLVENTDSIKAPLSNSSDKAWVQDSKFKNLKI